MMTVPQTYENGLYFPFSVDMKKYRGMRLFNLQSRTKIVIVVSLLAMILIGFASFVGYAFWVSENTNNLPFGDPWLNSVFGLYLAGLTVFSSLLFFATYAICAYFVNRPKIKYQDQKVFKKVEQHMRNLGWSVDTLDIARIARDQHAIKTALATSPSGVEYEIEVVTVTSDGVLVTVELVDERVIFDPFINK
jgi:hypothetical protein